MMIKRYYELLEEILEGIVIVSEPKSRPLPNEREPCHYRLRTVITFKTIQGAGGGSLPTLFYTITDLY